MFGYEKQIVEQLKVLKEKHYLAGIKAEFEAEGSTFNDLVRLRRMTLLAGTRLHLKIGGVEALRDIKDSLELGVDGLVAPMVESKFGLKKFLECYRSIYGNERIHLSINIETRNSVEELDDILDLAKGNIDNITLGRTDLSGSYLDPAIIPDSDFVMNLMDEIGKKTRTAGLTFTVGGSITAKTIEIFKSRHELTSNIEAIETRKVILPREAMLAGPEALQSSLHFEQLYIQSKKEISDLMVAGETSRLEKLSLRA